MSGVVTAGNAAPVQDGEASRAQPAPGEGVPAEAAPTEGAPAVVAPVDAGGHPGAEQFDLCAVLHALSDPVRLEIVRALDDSGQGGEMACKAFQLPVVKSTATHHFRVLREAGVIRQRVFGTTRLNALRREELEERFPGLLDAVLGASGR